MARYRIIEPCLRVVPQGKQNAGKKYLYAKLQNTMCIWEEPQTYTTFNEYIVKAFEQLLPVQQGGLAAEAKEIPAELSIITGSWVNYKPEQKFHKVHLSNHPAVPPSPTNPRGRAAIKAGDIVSRNGIPIVYDTLRVFCCYYIDEFGKQVFQRGEEPHEVGDRAFKSYCIPISEDKTPQTINSGNPPEENGNPPVNTPPVNPPVNGNPDPNQQFAVF